MTLRTKNSVMAGSMFTERKSSVCFDQGPVEDFKLKAIFNAARIAPSSRNEQPWRFIYTTSDDIESFNSMLGLLAEGNRRWAKNAPVLVMTFGRKNSETNSTPNAYFKHDAGLANAAILHQATELGLITHIMGGFDKSGAIELYNVPEEFEPLTVIALGYKGDPSLLEDDLREREESERNRKPLSEIVFRNSWQQNSW